MTTDMEQFYTRDAANEGVKLPLKTKDSQKTEHWILVRGIDSDRFRMADMRAKRGLVNLVKLDEEHRDKALAERQVVLVSSMVADWSFEQPCTAKNVQEFLRKAPQFLDQLDRIGSCAFFRQQIERLIRGESI